MASENLGRIYYEVDVDTSRVVSGAAAVDSSIDKVDSRMDKAGKTAGRFSGEMTKTASSIRKANTEASGASSAFSSLTKIVGAYLSIQSVRTLVAMSDQYGQMASRIRQVSADSAEYNMIQDRLLDTANKTYRPLAEAQEVFIRTSSAIKDLGYTTGQALDITDSFSFLLVTNAASADRASSAINAYSKAIQTGKVDSETWQSILAATPTIVDTIAAATGRSAEEIRKLGITGKLNLEALNEGLRRSRDANEELAASMETSVQDAFTALTNSLTVFVGKVNESSGASGVLTSAVGDLAAILQDPETIRAAQDLAAGVVQALNAIIATAKEVVNITRWMAENVAAALNGAASDDIVRLQDQLETFQAMLDNPLRRLRIGGKGQALALFSEDEIKANIAATQAQIDAFWDSQQNRTVDLPTPVPDIPQETPALVNAVAAATEKASKSRKKLTEAEKEAQAAARELQRAQETDIQVLLRLSEQLYQTTLSATELRDRQAELSLSKYATPEQVEEVKRLNAELAKTDELQKRKDAFGEGSIQDQIRGDVTPLSGGQFDDQTARYEAEALAEQKRYADAQTRLNEALELELVTKAEYQALELEMYQTHSDRLAQIDQARQEMQIQSWAQGFGQMSQDLQAFASTFADENSAMFKVAKAAAIAQAVMNTYQAATGAMASLSAIPIVGPALGIAAAAAAVAGGMAQVANIRSQSVPGRRYGGSVDANSMYQVNENGAPELLRDANGRQYLLPNTRGEVVSNQDARDEMGGGYGGGSVTVNQTIQVTGTVDRYTAQQLASATARQQRASQSRLGK